jgi:hypothetical protein
VILQKVRRGTFAVETLVGCFVWRGKAPWDGLDRGWGLSNNSKKRVCEQVAEIFTVDIGVEGTRIKRI